MAKTHRVKTLCTATGHGAALAANKRPVSAVSLTGTRAILAPPADHVIADVNINASGTGSVMEVGRIIAAAILRGRRRASAPALTVPADPECGAAGATPIASPRYSR